MQGRRIRRDRETDGTTTACMVTGAHHSRVETGNSATSTIKKWEFLPFHALFFALRFGDYVELNKVKVSLKVTGLETTNLAKKQLSGHAKKTARKNLA